MFGKSSRFCYSLIALSLLVISACSSQPALIAKSAAVPRGVDLSGQWLVRDGSQSAPQTDTGLKSDELIMPRRSSRSNRRRSDADASVRVFLEFGTSLKISQTFFGLFISYDRSVVEEFTYGENRLVTVGPIEAMRVSGWEGDSFVVETMDAERSILRESWRLDESAQVMVRDLRITQGDKESFRQQQVFDRQ